jgi:hypothetical protein
MAYMNANGEELAIFIHIVRYCLVLHIFMNWALVGLAIRA